MDEQAIGKLTFNYMKRYCNMKFISNYDCYRMQLLIRDYWSLLEPIVITFNFGI